MFDWTDYQSKGTKYISIIGPKDSSAATNQISVVAPGGPKRAKNRAIKSAISIADDHMAVALGGEKRSKRSGKRRGPKKGKTRGPKKGKRKGVKRGEVKKGVAVTKGRVRVRLGSGKIKSVSAAQVVRKLPPATLVKLVTSIRKKGGKRKKSRR